MSKELIVARSMDRVVAVGTCDEDKNFDFARFYYGSLLRFETYVPKAALEALEGQLENYDTTEAELKRGNDPKRPSMSWETQGEFIQAFQRLIDTGERRDHFAFGPMAQRLAGSIGALRAEVSRSNERIAELEQSLAKAQESAAFDRDCLEAHTRNLGTVVEERNRLREELRGFASPTFEPLQFVKHTPTGRQVRIDEIHEGTAIVSEPFNEVPWKRKIRVRLVDLAPLAA